MSRSQLTSTVEQNTGGAVAPYVAGKNAIINGGMDIWQRGTSIAIPASTTVYTCDRFQVNPGANAATTVSRQLTSDTTNLPNIQYCARVQRNSGQTGTTTEYFGGALESINSIPFAGKQVTLSFYARSGANFSAASNILSYHILTGTGTDQALFSFTGQVDNAINATLTTTWQKFTQTITVPTTATQLGTAFGFTPTGTAGANDYFEITGVQLELGSVATPFSRAGGTLSGELMACQRYFETSYDTGATIGGTSTIGFVGSPVMATNTGSNIYRALYIPYKVTKRATPTITTYDGLGASGKITTYSSVDLTQTKGVTGTADNIGMQNYRVYWLTTNGGAGWHHTISAEL